MNYEYRTICGTLQWDDKVLCIEYADDPSPPDDRGGWELCGSAISALRSTQQTILWFWKKPLT